MFSNFASVPDLFAAGSPFIAWVSDMIYPVLGVSVALAILGLLLRGKSGGGDRPGGSEISTGAPSDRPKRIS